MTFFYRTSPKLVSRSSLPFFGRASKKGYNSDFCPIRSHGNGKSKECGSESTGQEGTSSEEGGQACCETEGLWHQGLQVEVVFSHETLTQQAGVSAVWQWHRPESCADRELTLPVPRCDERRRAIQARAAQE
jgi:hypothetical protein